MAESRLELRDRFAAQALEALLAKEPRAGKDRRTYLAVAREAYTYADAMLEARRASMAARECGQAGAEVSAASERSSS